MRKWKKHRGNNLKDVGEKDIRYSFFLSVFLSFLLSFRNLPVNFANLSDRSTVVSAAVIVRTSMQGEEEKEETEKACLTEDHHLLCYF